MFQVTCSGMKTEDSQKAEGFEGCNEAILLVNFDSRGLHGLCKI